MKAIASRAIAAIEFGVLPRDAPTWAIHRGLVIMGFEGVRT
jgi:hypothetical protein